MKKILAEISLGELADKLTILEIKLKKIEDKESINIIKKEYQSLNNIDLKGIDLKKYKALFNELKSVNEKLWDIENEKRLLEKNSDFEDKFIQVSRNVHFMNDKRAKIAICPPVIFAANRIVNANGFTIIPINSMGIKIIYTGHANPCGTKFFQ